MTPAPTRLKTVLYGSAVFAVFFVYYLWTSSALPLDAGPDFRANNDAAEFIFKHHRLAVLPEDEDLLHFTAHGGTRMLRPPLNYIVSAAVATVYPTDSYRERFLAFRKGSSLLGALTVVVSFYALSVFFGSYLVALLGSALIGLLPQFAFIASYNNDDSGAILSATLAFASMMVIHKRGLNLRRAVFVGLAVGLVILSKFTAWLVLPFALGLVLWVTLTTLRPAQWTRYGVVALVAVLIGGGWWILFNMYHYGLNDPLANKIGMVMGGKHRRLAQELGHGFAAEGIGFYALVIGNYGNYLVETAKSTVGNLDWLRLKMGWLQYGAYFSVFIVAMGYFFYRVVEYCAALARGPAGAWRDQRFLLEALLFGAIAFQFFMYTWTNIHNDIQIQGKYLLPVFMPVLLLFLLAARRLAAFAWQRLARRHADRIEITRQRYRTVSLAVMIVLVGVTHADALLGYVIPYYDPPLYTVAVTPFKRIDDKLLTPLDTRNLRVHSGSDGIVFDSTADDPWVVWQPELCRHLHGNAILRFTIEAQKRDMFQIFLDEGAGFSERRSYRLTYDPGTQEILLSIGSKNCRQIRFDPASGAGRVVMRDLSIANLGIRPQR